MPAAQLSPAEKRMSRNAGDVLEIDRVAVAPGTFTNVEESVLNPVESLTAITLLMPFPELA